MTPAVLRDWRGLFDLEPGPPCVWYACTCSSTTTTCTSLQARPPGGTSPRDTSLHPGLSADQVTEVRDSLGKGGHLSGDTCTAARPALPSRRRQQQRPTLRPRTGAAIPASRCIGTLPRQDVAVVHVRRWPALRRLPGPPSVLAVGPLSLALRLLEVPQQLRDVRRGCSGSVVEVPQRLEHHALPGGERRRGAWSPARRARRRRARPGRRRAGRLEHLGRRRVLRAPTPLGPGAQRLVAQAGGPKQRRPAGVARAAARRAGRGPHGARPRTAGVAGRVARDQDA